MAQPHDSDIKPLLLEKDNDMCFGCHVDVHELVKKADVHPALEGGCTSCHNPHGGPNGKHLIAEFSPDPYVSYTDTAYPLCFSCHKRDLVQYPETSFATGFRDGERNLHFAHVNNKTKGRSCRMCHNVHGGNQPMLIADSAPFGKWSPPLKFVNTETGGSLAPANVQAEVS